MKKLDCILLIDDDKATNFIHEIIIKKLDCAKRVVVCEDANSAIKYLTNTKAKTYIKPDLILLDINMPGMTGWDFVEHYNNMSKKGKTNNLAVIVLTTSFNPEDKIMAENNRAVSGFINKPLSKTDLLNIIKNHFAK